MLDRRRFSPITPFRGASVYGDVPEYVNDFVNGIYRSNWAFVSLSDAITFSRASNATMINSEGVLVTVGPNVPRLNHHVYNGDTFVNKGLLHESEARTNFLTYSEDFTIWVSSNPPTVTANAATSPDGSTSATALLANGTGGFQQITLRPTLADSTDYCFSVYFKAAVGNSGVRLALTGKDGITRYFGALSDGSLSTPTGATNVIINTLGNNWYRLSGVLNSYSGAATSTVRIYITNSTGSVNPMVSGDGIYIYGAQLEAASTPSSYIPTAGATATRAAETLTIPAANLPWNPLSISIQMQGEATGDTYTTTRWYLDANNYITQNIGTSDFTFTQANAGVVDAVTGGSFTSGVNSAFNFASRHGATLINGAVDGTALTADTTPVALPDLSATDLHLGYDYMGTISLLRIWADDIGDSGIEEASS